MQIEIRDPKLEARIQEQLKSTGSKNVKSCVASLKPRKN